MKQPRARERGKKRAIMYSIALLLAVANDVIDLAGLGAPLPEAIIDGMLALAIISSLPKRGLTDVLSAIADIITGIDIAPIWSIYVMRRIRKDRE